MTKAQSIVGLKNTAGYSDFLEDGINYTGDFSGVTVAAAATVTSGNGRNASVTAPALKDFTAWELGGQIGYAGFKVGGTYVDADNLFVPVRTSSGDQHAWNAGASYTTGPLAVGIAYLDAEGYKAAPGANLNGTYAEQYQLYGLSGAYTLAPGLIIQSDLLFLDEELKQNAAATTKVDSDGLRVADQHPPELLRA